MTEATTIRCDGLGELNSQIIALGDQGYRIITVITRDDSHTIVAQKDDTRTMKLVRLTSEHTVMPTQIAGLRIDNGRDAVFVDLTDGQTIWVSRDYGSSGYRTKDRLEALINEAMR